MANIFDTIRKDIAVIGQTAGRFIASPQVQRFNIPAQLNATRQIATPVLQQGYKSYMNSARYNQQQMQPKMVLNRFVNQPPVVATAKMAQEIPEFFKQTGKTIQIARNRPLTLPNIAKTVGGEAVNVLNVTPPVLAMNYFGNYAQKALEQTPVVNKMGVNTPLGRVTLPQAAGFATSLAVGFPVGVNKASKVFTGLEDIAKDPKFAQSLTSEAGGFKFDILPIQKGEKAVKDLNKPDLANWVRRFENEKIPYKIKVTFQSEKGFAKIPGEVGRVEPQVLNPLAKQAINKFGEGSTNNPNFKGFITAEGKFIDSGADHYKITSLVGEGDRGTILKKFINQSDTIRVVKSSKGGGINVQFSKPLTEAQLNKISQIMPEKGSLYFDGIGGRSGDFQWSSLEGKQKVLNNLLSEATKGALTPEQQAAQDFQKSWSKAYGNRPTTSRSITELNKTNFTKWGKLPEGVTKEEMISATKGVEPLGGQIKAAEQQLKISTGRTDIFAPLRAEIKRTGGGDKEYLSGLQSYIRKQEYINAPVSQFGVPKVTKGVEGVKAPIVTPPTTSTEDYLKQLQHGQQGVTEKGGLFQRGKSLLSDIKRKLVDSTAPIEDILAGAQKKGKYEVLPTQNISNQIDRVLRSKGLATQFAKDNGLIDVIKGVPDVNALNQYLIAQHAPEVAAAGFKTGRNAAQDTQLVKDLAPVYEPYAQKVIQYGQKLLDYATESGLVDPKLAKALKVKYPKYVPLNRIFDELEKGQQLKVGAGITSLSKQTVLQKLQGSERAISSPIESLLSKTSDAFSQGERNIAGRQLASYRDLPGFEGLIRELKKGESAVHTFSYLDNGVKRTFETTPEIAQAAKLLDKQQFGLLGKIFALPVRIARVGITGINPPFVAANVARDQVTATINSSKALQTSAANPPVFLKALWTAVGHGAEYDNWIRSAAGGTSFDISREAPNITVAQLRASRGLPSQILYTVTHPGDFLRTIENVVNRGEETTRLQQFIGTREALLKEGRTMKDATIIAAKQSREATVNFARSGDWGRALNSAFLYVNAGIQGSRTLVRNLMTRPIQTTAKITATVLLPVATITAWNISDPQRKAAYDDIRTFEKDNNLVIIPPNPTKDANGKWNVIKIPFSQEIANLTVPIRKGIESLQGYNPPSFADISLALLGTGTSLNVQSSNAIVGQFTPQAVKPALEMTLNKNLFTGADIVPQYINKQPSANLPPSMQVYPNTSGTARILAKPFNISPLKAEEAVKSTFGGIAPQILNASDTALAASGIIPKNQVGGQSVPAAVTARFTKATGGQQLSDLYDTQQKLNQQINGIQSQIDSGTIDSQTGYSQIAQLKTQLGTTNAAIKTINPPAPRLTTKKITVKKAKVKKIKLAKAKKAKTVKIKAPKLAKAKTLKVKLKKPKLAKVKQYKVKLPKIAKKSEKVANYRPRGFSRLTSFG